MKSSGLFGSTNKRSSDVRGSWSSHCSISKIVVRNLQKVHGRRAAASREKTGHVIVLINSKPNKIYVFRIESYDHRTF